MAEEKCPVLVKVKNWGYFPVANPSIQEEPKCGSIPKQLEPTQKAIYDNEEKRLIVCDTDKKFPPMSVGRVGSHERCLSIYLATAKRNGPNEEAKVMFRSTRLTRGTWELPTAISLYMESFSPHCKVQARRVYEAIKDMESKSWIEKDDLLHVDLAAQDCYEKFGGSPLAVKTWLKERGA